MLEEKVVTLHRGRRVWVLSRKSGMTGRERGEPASLAYTVLSVKHNEFTQPIAVSDRNSRRVIAAKGKDQIAARECRSQKARQW